MLIFLYIYFYIFKSDNYLLVRWLPKPNTASTAVLFVTLLVFSKYPTITKNLSHLKELGPTKY